MTPAPAPALIVLMCWSSGVMAQETSTSREARVEKPRPGPVRASTTFTKDILRVDRPSDAGAILIETDDVTLDLGGSEIVGAAPGARPDAFAGRGIVIRGARNVTVRNAILRGFKIAIFAEDAPRLTIENCDVSGNFRPRLRSTPGRDDPDDRLPPEEGAGDWPRRGAGIHLDRCAGAVLRGNRGRYGGNGLMLIECDDATVADNDFAFLSGWGLAMRRSSRVTIRGNRFDYCVRARGACQPGEGPAGILLREACDDNVIAFNRATHCGHGLLMVAGEEAVRRRGTGGCNRNLVCMNEFSGAIACGVDASCCAENVVIANQLLDCDTGLHAALSRDWLVAGNEIAGCAVGVRLESGHRSRVEWNLIDRCAVGMEFRESADPALLRSAFAEKSGVLSRDEKARSNEFVACLTALRAADVTGIHICGNSMERCDVALDLSGKTLPADFSRNAIEGGRIRARCADPVVGDGNFLAAGVETEGNIAFALPVTERSQADAMVPRTILANTRTRGGPAWLTYCDIDIPAFKKGLPVAAGEELPGPLPGASGARGTIQFDEWGPSEKVVARVSPARAIGGTSTTHRVLGSGSPFVVEGVEGDVVVEPKSGVTPADIRVQLALEAPGWSRYAVKIKVGEQTARAEGLLLRADWDVRFHRWDRQVDPRTNESAWRKLTAERPIHTTRSDRIDFDWGASGPRPDEPGDFFALTATAKLQLPTGRWRLHLSSDDSARLIVDGRTLIDCWSSLGKDDGVVEVSLPGGGHAFRIDYVEVQGPAKLHFTMEPAER